MTSLPSIRQGKRMSGLPSKSLNQPSSPNKMDKAARTTPVSPYRRQTRFLTQAEQEQLKAERIRKKEPPLNKFETAYYRNSYIHNLCVKMLKEGYHQSFDELFSLNSKRKQERIDAGPDSILWEEQPLEDQHEKLDEICSFLTKGEYAARLGKWDDVYACRHALAQYFLECGDLWLSDHFFQTALQISLNIKLDGRRRESEAHCHMALACERRGEHEEACRQMQEFYQLTLGRLWADENDINLHHISCRHLCRIYTTLADHTTNKPEIHEYLNKAFEMSKEGEDRLQEGEAAYRLGCAYETSHDSETAIEYLNQCLTTATECKENELIGKACEALAKSHQTLGGIPKSIEFLEIFAATSKNSGRKTELVDACNCLGIIYNTLGKYEQSISHFNDSYNVSQELQEQEEENPLPDDMMQDTNRPALEECASQLGIAKGNKLLETFSSNMEIIERVMMERIVAWKDERSDEFGQPLPQPKLPTPPPSPEKVPDPTEPFTDAERQRRQSGSRASEAGSTS
ncbi:uncharacterized protein LOC120340468 [Styela clava]